MAGLQCLHHPILLIDGELVNVAGIYHRMGFNSKLNYLPMGFPICLSFGIYYSRQIKK